MTSSRSRSTPRPVSACNWNEVKLTTSATLAKNLTNVGTSSKFPANNVVLNITARLSPRARSMYSRLTSFNSRSVRNPLRPCVMSTWNATSTKPAALSSASKSRVAKMPLVNSAGRIPFCAMGRTMATSSSRCRKVGSPPVTCTSVRGP